MAYRTGLTDHCNSTTNRRTSSSRHWTPSSWTTIRVSEQGGAPRLTHSQQADPPIFHGAVDVLFGLPGRSSSQYQNPQLCTFNNLRVPPKPVMLLFLSVKSFAVRETRLGFHGLTKVLLRLSPINQMPAITSHPMNTPRRLRSQGQLRISSPHTQISHPSFLTTTFGRRVQPSRDAIETPPRSY